MSDELRSLHMRYDRMSAEGVTTEVAIGRPIGAVRKNLMYCNFVDTQHGLFDVMTFEHFKAKTMQDYF